MRNMNILFKTGSCAGRIVTGQGKNITCAGQGETTNTGKNTMQVVVFLSCAGRIVTCTTYFPSAELHPR